MKAFTPTPEQENALQQIAEETGSDTHTIIAKAIDIVLDERNRRLEELRRELQQGFASGPARVVDIEDIIARGRATLARQQTQHH